MEYGDKKMKFHAIVEDLGIAMTRDEGFHGSHLFCCRRAYDQFGAALKGHDDEAHVGVSGAGDISQVWKRDAFGQGKLPKINKV